MPSAHEAACSLRPAKRFFRPQFGGLFGPEDRRPSSPRGRGVHPHYIGTIWTEPVAIRAGPHCAAFDGGLGVCHGAGELASKRTESRRWSPLGGDENLG